MKKKYLAIVTLAASMCFSTVSYADVIKINDIVLSDTPEEAVNASLPGVIDIGSVVNNQTQNNTDKTVNQLPHENAEVLDPDLIESESDPRDISTMPPDTINSLGVRQPLHLNTILSYSKGPEEEIIDENGNIIKPTKVNTIMSGVSGPDDRDNYKENVSSETVNGPGSGATVAVNNPELRNSVIEYAKQFVGNPYVYGGTSLTEGADCSGFVMRVFEHFGINTGRDSRSQAANCRQIDVNSIAPGDLLFYASGDTINHVAIYIGNDQIVHAEGSDSGITISYAFYRTPYMAGTFIH